MIRQRLSQDSGNNQMNSTTRAAWLGALAFASLSAPLLADAQTLVKSGEFRGHYYEVYKSNGISWPAAKTYADARSYGGAPTPGHLATITSAGEDDFLESLRQQALAITGGLARPEVYVGGSQPAGASTTEGWVWQNGEGLIAGTNAGPGYANWLSGEPNDAGSGESHLAIGLGGAFGWNDEGALGNIGGFIVEYDVPIPLTTCADGCETIPGGGQKLTFNTPIPPGASITVQRFEYTDTRVSAAGICNGQKLTLFGDDGDPTNDLIIPGYLCGSPQFIVVAVKREGFDILQGTVLVENDVKDILPDNLYWCELTIDNDPQHRDVVVWQSTNPAQMLEKSTGGTIASVFDGAAGEYTNECINPSRGVVRSGSYFVVGLSINFGQTLVSNPTYVFDQFVALTRYKLVMLKETVDNAYADRAIKRGPYRVLSALVIANIRLLDRGRLTATRAGVRLFNVLARAFPIATVPGQNYEGEFASRGTNIEFTLTEKVIPYAP
jgi:hypothetical protein